MKRFVLITALSIGAILGAAGAAMADIVQCDASQGEYPCTLCIPSNGGVWCHEGCCTEA